MGDLSAAPGWRRRGAGASGFRARNRLDRSRRRHHFPRCSRPRQSAGMGSAPSNRDVGQVQLQACRGKPVSGRTLDYLLRAHGRHIAPYRGANTIQEKDWIPITDGRFRDHPDHWSPGGNALYFLSDRDGYVCIWAERLDASTKRPSGAPVVVYHAHGGSRSMTEMLVEAGFSLAQDRIAFNMEERTGNIWMAEWK